MVFRGLGSMGLGLGIWRAARCVHQLMAVGAVATWVQRLSLACCCMML